MPTNEDYTNEYCSIIDDLQGDISGRKAAYDYMKNSTAIYHGEVVDFTFVPRLFNAETRTTLENIATTTHTIVCKVIQRYLDDPEYRDCFDFDKRLEELILLPRGYDALLPFARFDIFLNEENQTAKFCEFNADGSSGMNENREISNAIIISPSYQNFAKEHQVELCELHNSWVEEFLEIYSTYKHKVENPHIAICDFLENAVVDEFKVYAHYFEEHGVSCSVHDVRDLRFDGEALRSEDGTRIDAIWRRCVTNDIIDNWESAQELISAVKAEKVALIGSFAGHIVHDKQIFEVLMKPETTAFLSADEITFLEQSIPLTQPLDAEFVNIEQIKQAKDNWIIKPTDKYGATDVFAGCYFGQDEWEKIVDTYANGATGQAFILQEYCTPYRTKTLPPSTNIDSLPDDEIKSDFVSYNNLSGLYVYNGTFRGVFSRLGPLPTISKSMRGVTAATIWTA